MEIRNRPQRSSARKNPQEPAASLSWRHALQDLEPVIYFANQRPKDAREYEEAIVRLVARPAAGSTRLHSPASIALLNALGGTAFNAPLRFADVILADPKQDPWQNANAQKRALAMIPTLRERTVRILDRLVRGNAVIVNGIARPELDPKSRRIDFVVNGRDPIDVMTFGPMPRYQLPVVYDIHDALFAKVRNLIDRVQRPVRLRGEHGKIIPFWPLAHCLVCGRFYFKSRSDRRTCSRRCTQRWDHLRRQRTVVDRQTGKYLKQHDLKVTVSVVKVRR